MNTLYNKVSQQELKQKLLQENEQRTTISFYQYFFIESPKQFRDDLYKSFFELKVFGRVYVASEGINAQISVLTNNVEAFKIFLKSQEALKNCRLNIGVDDDGKSFWVLKIKVRNKIVADGIDDPNFNMHQKGKYVTPLQMNEMMQADDTIVIDMRNHYEYEVGHFKNAIEIPSDTFRDQLPMAVEMMKDAKEKNIVMYCTGGIRCEKASAYMLHNGFNKVYHLEGGIINYANQIKQQNVQNNFIGKNFVFDNRLGERITEDIIAHCHQCQLPADTHTNCKNDGCHILFIQCQNCGEKYNGCCSKKCQDIYLLPEEEQRLLRKGIDKGNMVFNKSKQRLRPTISPIEED
jgi:UPF0176 protein